MDGKRTSGAGIKGAAAFGNPDNPYHTSHYVPDDGQEHDLHHVTYVPVYPRTILNRVKVPSLGFAYSLNPYQGCEHGCIYCYARPTHQYWDLGAGIDFERKIFYKPTSAQLLAATFRKKSYQPGTILMSGNTDCYQPLERHLRITRSLLEVFVRFRHPVSILTKNALIQRDMDLLRELKQWQLVSVTLSITSCNEALRRVMEPRTVSYARKLNLIQQLRDHDIPVGFIIGPIIPGLNDDQVFQIIKDAASAGAQWGHYTLLRLPDPLPALFEDWLVRFFPDRKSRVLKLLKEARQPLSGQGSYRSYVYGDGPLAHHIQSLFNTAIRKAGLKVEIPTLSFDHFQHGIPRLF